MKKFLSIFAVVALVAGFVMMAPDAFAAVAGGTINEAAQGSGQTVLIGLSSVFSGNLALAAGLGLAFFGFWMWAVQQQSWGLVILICGVIITAFPGIFEGMTKGTTAIASAFAGADGTAVINKRAVDVTN